VISAIAKYNLTELSRQIINNGMDILGGSGICRGPRNLLANIYIATPISITVEGANILTRTMMIFGQGAIRCHPYVYAEVIALKQSDVSAFDRAFWHHIGFMVRNGCRALLLSLSRGYLARPPVVTGATAKYYRKLTWAAATFAFLTDLVLFCFGGTLKRREKLTGRFADILSWMYLGTATLRRFEAEGRTEDLPFVRWAMEYALAQIQQGFEGIFSNLPVPILGSLFQYPITWWWRLNAIGSLPSDRLGSEIARSLQTPGQQRDRLTAGIFIPSDPSEALGRLEGAFLLSAQAEPALKTIKAASRGGKLPPGKPEQLVTVAQEAEIITQVEAELIRAAEIARHEAIQVDTFTLLEYQQGDRPSLMDRTALSHR
jgi:acyl-CoA dehydrogenase